MLTRCAAHISHLVSATASFVGFKNLMNLIIGFGLLVLLVLLVQELSASRGGRR
jgi:hypothetical protein